MHSRDRFSTFAACLIGLALMLALPSAAAAQMREFSGRVVQVSGAQLVVDSAGDKITFAPAPDVVVSGARSSWAAIQADDRVTVSWKLADAPRKAYKIVVTAARKDD